MHFCADYNVRVVINKLYAGFDGFMFSLSLTETNIKTSFGFQRSHVAHTVVM